MADPIVEIKDLKLSLVGGAGPVNILRGIDLQVAAGETVSIVGPSGAGKTSLLMVLSGLEKADSGAIQVSGVDLLQLDEDELARFRRQHVGIVFQSFHLVPTMTALENVALPLEFAGVDDAMEQAAAALQATGLATRQAHFQGQLSGVEQQREKVMELLFGLQREFGTTLLLVTHDDKLAARCGRTLQMTDGYLQSLTGEVA